MLILADELERRGIPSDGLGMTMLVANTILRCRFRGDEADGAAPGPGRGDRDLSRLHGVARRFGRGLGEDHGGAGRRPAG